MSRSERKQALRRLEDAGRSLSDAAVLYHGAMADRVGLNPSQWKVLGLLQRWGPLTAGELATRSGLAPPSVSGILDRLEGRGLLGRSPDPGDRRRIRVEVRVEGLAELYQAFEGLTRRLADLHSRYSPEEMQLIAGYLEEAAARQREATAELAGGEEERP